MTEINVTNSRRLREGICPEGSGYIKAAGGKQLAIGGCRRSGANKVTTVEGDPPSALLFKCGIAWKKSQSWRNSADYKEARKIGDKYATFAATPWMDCRKTRSNQTEERPPP